MDTTFPKSNAAKDVKDATERIVDTVSETADSAVKQGKRLAQNASDTASRAAEYLREGGASELGGKLKDYLVANPTHAVIGAAFVGFVVGRMMSRH